MPATSPQLTKVVAHAASGELYKGYPAESDGLVLESLLRARASLPSRLRLKLADSDEVVELDLATMKALFFVRSFEGRTDYSEVKFFDAHPPVEGLWVRLRFEDGESTEGVAYNSIALLRDGGFFLKPPDPNSNNQVMYVLKQSLAEFRVLGVRGSF